EHAGHGQRADQQRRQDQGKGNSRTGEQQEQGEQANDGGGECLFEQQFLGERNARQHGDEGGDGKTANPSLVLAAASPVRAGRLLWHLRLGGVRLHRRVSPFDSVRVS